MAETSAFESTDALVETSISEVPDAVVATRAVEAPEAAAEQTVVIPAAELNDVDNLADTTVLDDVADTTEFSEDDTAGLDARIAVATAAATASLEEPLTVGPQEPASEAVSPYESTQTLTDPTPTEAFAIAMGAHAPRKRRRWVLPVAVLVVLAVGYGLLAFILRDSIPEGTTVGGVPAGDTVSEATQVVGGIATVAASTPITLTAGDNSTTVLPADAGLSVDVDATVDAAGGFTLDPRVLWHRLTGEGTDHEVVVAVDEAALSDAVTTASAALDSTAADASVTIDGAQAVVTPGTQTVSVDQDAADDDILEAWPTLIDVELTADVEDPAITTKEATTLAASLNGHVFAGPTKLTGDNGDVVLPAEQVAAHSTVVAADGVLAWEVDGEALSQLILTAYPWVENESTNATYHFTKAHNLKVTRGEPSRELDTTKVGDAVITAGGTLARTAAIPYIVTEPKVTAEELPTQDFTTLVSHFRTPLTPEPVRTKNLVRAAQLVTGTVVKAGDRFDLTKTVSPITRENGYYEAHVIVNGLLTTGLGGGLSQMATTSFNAGYFAGYKDITHQPHSVWFPRYPAGRESTIYSGQINVVFENTTPYAMIMNSYVEDGYLNVDIWSTPYYKVKTWASPKTNIVQPHIVESSADGCISKGNGEPGFRITNTRWVYLGDDLQEKKSFTWTYRPDNGVRCVD